jgi:hypothetical protein
MKIDSIEKKMNCNYNCNRDDDDDELKKIFGKPTKYMSKFFKSK